MLEQNGERIINLDRRTTNAPPPRQFCTSLNNPSEAENARTRDGTGIDGRRSSEHGGAIGLIPWYRGSHGAGVRDGRIRPYGQSPARRLVEVHGGGGGEARGGRA